MMRPHPHAIAAEAVFDGRDLHYNHAVVIEGARVSAVVPHAEVPEGIPVRELSRGTWLAPGFVDVQVNGGGDVLFNDDPTPAGLAAIAAAHRAFGTTSLLPTLISDTRERMDAATAAVKAAMAKQPGIIGIHYEGPLLSPQKPGVHEPGLLRDPVPQDVDLFTSPGKGATVVTLAPERVPAGFIARLADSGVRVCLGHSIASYEQTRSAIADGLSGFTHLFNAMLPMDARAPGPIAAALEAPNVWFGMIVDGIHVDPAMLRLALRGLARPMLVTDAMPTVGGRRSSFRLYGEEITVRNGQCRRRDGTLAGAALDMATAVRNAVTLLDMPLVAALRAASAEPAAFLGIDDRIGYLRPGYRADAVAFHPDDMTVAESWLAGEGIASSSPRDHGPARA